MARPKEFDPDHVLDAAMDAFWGKGYAATSAQDLVDSTGLGRGSLYHAFSGKHHLFMEVLRRYEQRWTARQQEVLDGEGGIRERIGRVLMSVVDEEVAEGAASAGVEAGRRGCLAVNAAIELAGRDPEVTAQVERNFTRMEEILRSAIHRAQLDGEIARDKDPGALAQFTLNSMYGLRVLGKTADRKTLAGVVETVLQAL
ncbi:TetR/AcrR family transcriptional regulator [Streptomyces sp. NPDC007983]|uniref:TetR/AcrR family transcriptional regulator n=1 Tax=Streptomyces sp. NPDC007983 TaxID=3364800 RepID=UPI0036E67AF6